MKVDDPITLAAHLPALYLNFRRVTESLVVMLSVPFAAGGWRVAAVAAGLQPVVAVAVGFIALPVWQRRPAW